MRFEYLSSLFARRSSRSADGRLSKGENMFAADTRTGYSGSLNLRKTKNDLFRPFFYE